MPTISSADARGRFTKALIDVYQERIRPTAFLRSFFPVSMSGALEVSIEVERMGEKIAVDVVRGTEGNLNAFSKLTEKIWIPPAYSERFQLNKLDLYDRVLGSQGNANENLFAALLNKAADRLGTCQDLIERSMEVQCAQVFEDGIVTLQNATNINFQRRAASIVDPGAGNYFANNVDLYAQFQAAGTFLRQYGKSIDGTFNAILGNTAWNHLLANTVFVARQDLVSMKLDAVTGPARNGQGAVLMGKITAGPFEFILWTYPQYYDDANGVQTPYINDKKVYVFPRNPRFHMAHGLVEQLIDQPGQTPSQSTFVYDEKIDPWRVSHDMRVRTCPIAVPVAVDQLYTFRAVAA